MRISPPRTPNLGYNRKRDSRAVNGSERVINPPSELYMARPTTSRGQHSIGARRQPRLSLERLEHRALPSSTLYLDLGDNFPTAGFELTDGQLGSDLAAGGLSGPSLQ